MRPARSASLSTLSAIALFALSISLSGCGGIVDKRGYVRDDAAFNSILPGVDNKESVYQRLGSPSTSGTIASNTWYYITTREERTAFFAPEVKERNITAIEFDENDMVADVESYTLEDGKVVAYSDRETPTRGKELSFLEQMFGNIGRLPAPGSGGPQDQ